jgi:hypothetical protein
MTSHGNKLGSTDPTISAGLSVERASELILTAIHAKQKFNEIWIGQSIFLFSYLCFFQIFPYLLLIFRLLRFVCFVC